ncbi:MAG: DinB family protein [Candidatus Bipolaricaulia bacterium]
MNFQDLEGRRLQAQADFFVKTAEAIPEEKADDRPAETAMSAREIVDHCTESNAAMGRMLGEDVPDYDPSSADSFQKALQVFQTSCDRLSQTIASVPDERLEETVETGGGGSMPMKRILSIPSAHVGYHWGQLAYLQTIWGDTEDHFMG